MKFTIDIPIRFIWPDPREQPPTYLLYLGTRVLSCPAPLRTIKQIYDLLRQLRNDLSHNLGQAERRLNKHIDEFSNNLPSKNLKSLLDELTAKVEEARRIPISYKALFGSNDSDAMMRKIHKIDNLEARIAGLEKLAHL